MIAWIDLRSPERARDGSQSSPASPSFAASGISSTTSATRTGFSADDVRQGSRLLEERGLILELPCVFPATRDVPVLAARFPGMTIVIDHLASRRCAPRQWIVGRRVACRGRCTGTSWPRSPASTRCSRQASGAREDLRPAIEVALDAFGPERLAVRQRLAGGAPERRLRDGVARDDTRDRAVAPEHVEQLLSGTARARSYALDTATAPAEGAAVTAIDGSGDRQDQGPHHVGRVHRRLQAPERAGPLPAPGLSRNSLREAVRALTLIGVLEPRVGDGAYVTSLEPELLMTGMGFISDLLTGSTLLELHQVRRILEPVATEMAATRLDDGDLAALEHCLAAMDEAETTQAFIQADEEFHGIIVAASGNSTLASLIQNLSGGTLRARVWRSVVEQDAIEADQAPPLGHLLRAARRRCRARTRGRPDPPLRGRALARAADRGRRGDRRDRRRFRERGQWLSVTLICRARHVVHDRHPPARPDARRR